MSKLHAQMPEYLAFEKRLYANRVLGRFYTENGKDSGNGLYVLLRADNIEQARQLAA
jgi:hypothetical protein